MKFAVGSPDLHEYTADGEDRPPSLSSSASVCLSDTCFGLAVSAVQCEVTEEIAHIYRLCVYV